MKTQAATVAAERHFVRGSRSRGWVRRSHQRAGADKGIAEPDGRVYVGRAGRRPRYGLNQAVVEHVEMWRRASLPNTRSSARRPHKKVPENFLAGNCAWWRVRRAEPELEREEHERALPDLLYHVRFELRRYFDLHHGWCVYATSRWSRCCGVVVIVERVLRYVAVVSVVAATGVLMIAAARARRFPRMAGNVLWGARAAAAARALGKCKSWAVWTRCVTSCWTYGSSSAHKLDCDRVAWN